MPRDILHTSRALRLLGLLAASAALLGATGGTASASPTPPTASPALVGTWVNTNLNTNSLKRIEITRASATVAVDAFAACASVACQWGGVHGTIFGSGVSSRTGTTFATRQTFSTQSRVWGETELIGSLSSTKRNRVLTVRELTVFTDGSGRHNYEVTETFRLGSASRGNAVGSSGPVLPLGQPPLASPALAGQWVNTSSQAIARLSIALHGSSATVQAFGACVPTGCNIGTTRATIFGTNVGSARGSVLSASYRQSFGAMQMIISPTGKNTLRLELLRTLNGGRSNYVVIENLVRV